MHCVKLMPKLFYKINIIFFFLFIDLNIKYKHKWRFKVLNRQISDYCNQFNYITKYVINI